MIIININIHIEWKFLTQSWINYLIKSLLLQIMVKSFYGILTALAIDPEIGLLFVKQLKQMIWRWPNPPKSNILQEKDYYSVLNTEITFCIISQIRGGRGSQFVSSTSSILICWITSCILFLDHQNHQRLVWNCPPMSNAYCVVTHMVSVAVNISLIFLHLPNSFSPPFQTFQ